MSDLVFYTTEGCHLCEYAEQLLAQLGQHGDIDIETVDISSDESLVELYGIRIPVVKNKGSGEELGWPFSLQQLLGLVAA